VLATASSFGWGINLERGLEEILKVSRTTLVLLVVNINFSVIGSKDCPILSNQAITFKSNCLVSDTSKRYSHDRMVHVVPVLR
jgi:hypothetical protein